MIRVSFEKYPKILLKKYISQNSKTTLFNDIIDNEKFGNLGLLNHTC